MSEREPGTRKGPSRHAAKQRRSLDPRALALVGGTTAAVIAWVALVWSGITFGRSARGGDSTAWIFMGIASLGAVACLFLALILGWKVLRALGVAPRANVRSVAAKGGRRSAGKRSGPRR